MMMRSVSFPLTVTRREAVLISPAKPTPHELKPLSDIDEQHLLRIYVPHIQIYRGGGHHRQGKDPVRVIREALAEALVYYYPFAGRLREGIGRKLVVDCTGEGVAFVEADAGFTLEELGEEDGLLCPPFRNARNMFPDDVPVSAGVLNRPLLLFQVTRLKCGAMVVGISINHTMTDAAGLVQFMNAVAQLARGALHPSVVPVWRRELLESRNPAPTTSTDQQQYRHLEGFPFPLNYTNEPLIQRSFFFGSTAISALRRQLQPQMTRTTTFELLAAFLWRCRTIALRFDPDEELRFLCGVNIHRLLKSPPLPAAYYGNTFVLPEAVSTAGELCRNALHYAVELIKKAKAEVTEEYVRSLTDHLQAIRGEPRPTVPAGSWMASDNTRAGFHEIDFGWGKPVFSGPCSAMVGVLGSIGFLVRGSDAKGENGVILLICLPETAMERFAAEVGDSGVISKL